MATRKTCDYGGCDQRADYTVEVDREFDVVGAEYELDACGAHAGAVRIGAYGRLYFETTNDEALDNGS